MVDDFSGYPQSVNEIKADREADGKIWSPRDALISVLRYIDDGKVSPVAVVVSYLHKTDDEERVFYAISSPSKVTGLGLLSRVSYMLNDA